MPESPAVSIIIPCFNEQATISLLLDAIRQQTFPLDRLEVVIADGMSTDRTRDVILEYQAANPELRLCVVDNPARVIPAGLNLALEAAQGDIIIRLDAHSVPRPDYVQRCVAALQAGLGENVGGVWEIQPGGKGGMSRAIAVAAAHPLGVGDARYRYTNRAGEVDTVPFGAYRRDFVQNLGKYDATLLTNEDYELNVRIRQAGGRIYLDPDIRSTYFARPTLASLIRQYWRYGYWKFRMLQKYPQTLRWRQAMPPVFVAGLILVFVAGLWWRPAWFILVFGLAIYFLVLLAVGLLLALRQKDPALLWGVPLAILAMHITWGAGFLWSALRAVIGK
jgi:glycosyltransferase involved in cell wall biosynthesis